MAVFVAISNIYNIAEGFINVGGTYKTIEYGNSQELFASSNEFWFISNNRMEFIFICCS